MKNIKKVHALKGVKEIYDTLSIMYKGFIKVKGNKLSLLTHQ